MCFTDILEIHSYMYDSPGRMSPFQEEHLEDSEPAWQSWCKRSSVYHHCSAKKWKIVLKKSVHFNCMPA